jgi:predicted alpha/beta-hydrolase family hydrolase
MDGTNEVHKAAAKDHPSQPTEEAPPTQSYEIPLDDSNKKIPCIRHGAPTGPALIFTHGVGGGISSPAMQHFAEGFAPIAPVAYFQGNMNLTSRVKMFNAMRQGLNEDYLALGGRSMGARAAVLAALEKPLMNDDGDDGGKAKLILVSYPLTAGKDGGAREPERREQILLDLPDEVEILFVCGSRDKQCDMKFLGEVRGRMRARSWLIEVVGADHGMECRPKNRTEEIRRISGRCAAEWLVGGNRDVERRFCEVRVGEDGVVVSGAWVTERSERVADATDDE